MSKQSQDMPKIAKYKPYYCELSKGKKYFWCSCGLSKNQPFCDYSHVGTDFEPIAYHATQDNEEVLFCGCKRNKEGPFCDGSHNNLPGGYAYSNPASKENQQIELALENDRGVRVLDGNCFVASSQYAASKQYQNTKWAVLICALQGAVYQSLHYLVVAGDGKFSPNSSMGQSEVSLLVSKGEGEIIISNQQFQLGEYDGVYICAGETFSVRSTSAAPMELHLSVCPPQAAPVIVDAMLDNFDSSYPERVVPTDEAANQGVGDRFFQILVGKAAGSKRLTQFIGRIPTSMAAFHRHLYEESLVVLEGYGHMWSDTLKCRVRAGDIIFLPRKQLHSLQCDSPDGMVLVGFIYPGDNPSINY